MIWRINDHYVEPSDVSSDFIAISRYNSQLFYGEWEVTQIINGGRFFSSEKLEPYLGCVVSFSRDCITVNEKAIVEAPNYEVILVSSEDAYYLFKNDSPDSFDEILDASNDYFAYINIENTLEHSNGNSIFIVGFTIRDTNTLALQTNYGFLKLARLNYPENYRDNIIGP